MMKRIMITILAISALQANVFAADAAGNKKQRTAEVTADRQELTDCLFGNTKELEHAKGTLKASKDTCSAIEKDLARNGAKKATRSAGGGIAAERDALEISRAEVAAQAEALSAQIQILEERTASLREQISTAADAEQVRLNEELALIAADEAELKLRLGTLELGDANGDNPDAVTYDIDGTLVTNKEAYNELKKARLVITGFEGMLTSARESEAVLNGRIAAQSGSLLGQAAQSAGLLGLFGSAVLAVVDRFTGTKAALATTKGRIATLEEEIAGRGSLLAVLKSAACRPAAAHVHSGDAGV